MNCWSFMEEGENETISTHKRDFYERILMATRDAIIKS